MAIKIGNLDISAFKVGSGDCSIYLGDTLLYSGGTTPPVFQGKWLATYSGGTTSSADCDASSSITENEITLTDLVDVEIGNCVTSIGDGVFYACSSITSATIPNSVTYIGGAAFNNCSELTNVTIGSGVTNIDDMAFRNCTSLTSITVEATTPPTLGYRAFDNTNNCPIYGPASSVNAYKSDWSDYASRITAIPSPTPPVFQGKWLATYAGGTSSSADCDASSAITDNEITLIDLVSVEIGNCVTSISGGSFGFCNTLTSVTFTQGSQLTNIEGFDGCSSLTSITLPSGVTTIGGFALFGCSGLTSITIEATTPPILGEYAFEDTNDCPIYVPAESYIDYITDSDWSEYASRITSIQS